MTDDDNVDEHSDVRERLAAEPSPAMPDDVAAQLQRTLERESRSRQESYSGPATSDGASTVVPLGRRRRWKAPLAAAASVVAVVAVAIPVWNEMDSGGADSAAGGASDESVPNSAQRSEDGGASAAPDSGSGRPDDSVSQLSRADFAADVRALLVESDALAITGPSAFRSAVACGSGSPSSDRGVAATLDGRPVVILISSDSPVSPRVRARAVTCAPDGPHVAAQASVPDPR